MKLSELKTKEPFCSLFNIQPEILSAIKEDMEMNGYDGSQPIIIWNRVIIDGHTRYEAAKQANIIEIPIFAYDFDNELDALQYAIHNQRNRRNLTEAEIIRCVEVVDRLRERGQNLKEYPRDNKGHTIKPEVPENLGLNIPGKSSAQETAKITGLPESKVHQVRAVVSDPEAREAVESGIKSIHRAAQEVREKKKQEKESKPRPTFNRTNESIEWALWTWNPVTGCEHGCPYCYARDIAKRFYPPEIGFKPHFWPDRLEAPKNMSTPVKGCLQGEKTVFVCSMADLFGDWVPQEWIDQVIKAVNNAPDWDFLFLTKNPKRYLTINFPKNAWIGATADTQARADTAHEVFSELAKAQNRPTVMFLSMEPLSEQITISEPIPYDWLIIGGRSVSSSTPAMQPEWKWVKSLLWQADQNKIKLYFKPNLTVRPKEYPNQ